VPRVIGFKTIHDDDVAECLEVTRFHLSTKRLLEESLCSFEDGTTPTRRRLPFPRPPHLRPPVPSSLRVGWFVLRVDGRERRFRGLVRIRRVPSASTWIRRHLVAHPRTSLASWLHEENVDPSGDGWDRAARRALSRLRDELASPPYIPGEATVVSGFPGLYATHREGCFEVRQVEVGDRRLLARSWVHGLELRLERRVSTPSGRVPVVLRLRLSEDSGCSWYDGRSFGVCDLPDDVPSALRALLEARGTAFDHGETSMRPLGDLLPCFLVRTPTRRELTAAGGPAGSPPDCASAPAFVHASTEPLPLLEPDGSLRAIAAVTDPAQAGAILARCSERTIYVPNAPPIREPDLDLSGPRWRIGSQLLGVGA
jgi:hypothetical protein